MILVFFSAWGWIAALIGGAVLGTLAARGLVDPARLRRFVFGALVCLGVGLLTVGAAAIAVESPSTLTNWERHASSHPMVYLAVGLTAAAEGWLLIALRRDARARAPLAVGMLLTSAAALVQLLAFLGNQNFVGVS